MYVHYAVLKVSSLTFLRKEGKKFGFAESKVTPRITSSTMEKQTVPIKQHSEDNDDDDDSWDEMEEDQEEEEAGKMKQRLSREMEGNK